MMGRIFITGSTDGLGLLAARSLVKQGHRVVLHARNPSRGEQALRDVAAETFYTADLSSLAQTIALAEKLNMGEPFDAIIHNAGVYQAPPHTIASVNTFAPYILTSLVMKPARLVYLSSGLHLSGKPHLDKLHGTRAQISYADSKLHVTLLAFAVARQYPTVFSNAVNPGWVPTKMGGAGAPDDLQKGFETQAWLAVSDDAQAKVSGRYFFHQAEKAANPLAHDVALQQELLERCATITGVPWR